MKIKEKNKQKHKKIKTEGKFEKQISNTYQKWISNLFSKNFLAAEARDELNKIREIKKEINRDDLIHKTDSKKGIKLKLPKSKY